MLPPNSYYYTRSTRGAYDVTCAEHARCHRRGARADNMTSEVTRGSLRVWKTRIT